MMQSLESIPTWFSDFFDINVEAGEVILSIAVICAVLLPTMYLSMRMKTSTPVPTILMFFLTVALLVGIGWLDVWIMVTLVCVVAMAVAWWGRKTIGG